MSDQEHSKNWADVTGKMENKRDSWEKIRINENLDKVIIEKKMVTGSKPHVKSQKNMKEYSNLINKELRLEKKG